MDVQNRFGHRRDLDVFEFGFQHRLVGRLNVVAEDIFNRLVTLIHGLLDQRVAAERAHHVNARHIRFILRRKRRNCVHIGVREGNAKTLHQFTRRDRAQPGDDAVTGDRFLAGGGIGDKRHRKFVIRRDRGCVDAGHGGVVADGDLVFLVGSKNECDVAILHTHKFFNAVDQDDAILFGQRQCVLDTGIARADDDDGLVFVFCGIIELILHSG